MNRFENITKPLTWLMALLLTAFVAGCGGGNDKAAPSSAKRMITYSIDGGTGTINETLKTISVTKPYGTDVTAMVATFTYTGAKVTVSDATQINATDETQTSGITANDFTNPVAYKVTAVNGTWATYTVLVTIAANTAKAITAYSLAWTTGTPGSAAGAISGEAPTYAIAVTVPYLTDVTALVATFTTTGDSVTIGGVPQNSGLAPTNNFETSKTYRVTAADGSYVTYDVSVTVALNNAKAITDYSLDGMPGTINGVASPYTVAVTMPYGTTDLTALVATFTTTGDSVTIGGVTQTSGTTPNNFTTSKTYTVTAANGTSATYTVTVSVALNPAKAITAYSLAWSTGTPGSADGTISGVASPYAIAVTAPSGTDLTTMVATFTTTGDSVKIGSVTQISGSTPTNDFTNSVATPVAYLVTAEDGTTATYNVSVTLASAAVNPTAPTLGESGRFVILASAGVTGGAGSTVSNGDIGVTPAARTFITGFTPATSPADGSFVQLTNGMSYAPEDANPSPFAYPLKTGTLPIGSAWATTAAMLTQASTDLTTAYNFLAADPNPSVATTVLADPELGGKPAFTRGVYKTGAPLLVSTALQLDAEGDANAVWIFTTDSNLTTGATGNMSFVNGIGSAKNVYWRVGGTATIAAGTTFYGNVYAAANVDVNTGAAITGSLYSTTASITLITNTVTKAP